MNNNTTIKEIAQQIEAKDLTEVLVDLISKIIEIFIENELTEFLQYEKHSVEGNNSGNSRNGYTSRTIKSIFGQITIKVARDRNSEFKSKILKPYQRNSDELLMLIIKLTKAGMSTREISGLLMDSLGDYLSATAISNITKEVQEEVDAFHNRKITKKFKYLYVDATFFKIKTERNRKSAIHTVIGIDEDGYKELLDYRIAPTENLTTYCEMLEDLIYRGLGGVQLIIGDGFKGLDEATTKYFENSIYQECYFHKKRSIRNKTAKEDKDEMDEFLTNVFNSTSRDEAINKIENMPLELAKKYKSIQMELYTNQNLFSYTEFPVREQYYIRTNNTSESFNSKLKRRFRNKCYFGTEESLDRCIYLVVDDFNQNQARRRVFTPR